MVDSLEKGHPESLPAKVELVKADIGDRSQTDPILAGGSFAGVIHLAGSIESGESMARPVDFFENNLAKATIFLKGLLDYRLNWFVFSSTAGVYGETKDLPLKETAQIQPTSYYGWSKYFFEEVLRSARLHGLESIILRYFNAAGATSDGQLGEDHRPETHLIPLVFKAVLGEKQPFVIHGDDYPTPDGTGVRDFVHVVDLAQAHVLAIEALASGKKGSVVYNVGTGKGHSVKEVVAMVRQVTGRDFPVRIGPRRDGDWPVAFADPTKIKKELGWKPRYGLEEIIKTAWQWYRAHPRGFQT